MKYCPFCGAELVNEAVFCTSCGKKCQGEVTAQKEKPGIPASDDGAPQKKKASGAILIISVCLVLLCAVGAVIYFTVAERSRPFVDDTEAIASASGSVLMLKCYSPNGELLATGSGFAVFAPGVVLTNFHVIGGDTYFVSAQTEKGISFELDRVLAYDEDLDIALLSTSADAGINLLETGDAEALKKGETVVAIGSPLGLINTVSSGAYSGIVEREGRMLLQFSAAVSHGSSGGALFNNNGQVIGITSASYVDGQNINFAVPVSEAKKLYDSRPEKPLTFPEFYDLWDHIQTFSLQYILENYDEFLKCEGLLLRVVGIVADINTEDECLTLTATELDAEYYHQKTVNDYYTEWLRFNLNIAAENHEGIGAWYCPNLEDYEYGDELMLEGTIDVYVGTDDAPTIGLDCVAVYTAAQ